MNSIHTSDKDKTAPGTLFVVATPIGNLGEMSQRALETLQNVDLIACEDTRHTKKLCTAFTITTPLTSYYREKEHSKAAQLVGELLAGKNIALVSDAGTPGVSDPGAVLVKAARQAGAPVKAIAGPSALAAALSIAGISDAGFFFGGFLPAKSSERQRYLNELKPLSFPLIFYASPHRIKASLRDLQDILGDRQAMLLRELTKIHEECREGRLSVLLASVTQGIKGELVLIVEGAPRPSQAKPSGLEELVAWYKGEKKSTLKDTVRLIATDLDLPRSSVYKEVLRLWDKVEET